MKTRIVWKKAGIWTLEFLISLQFLHAHKNRLVTKDGKAIITLEDPIGHLLFWWSKTLLCYEILSDTPLNADGWCLTNQKTSRQVPFQLVLTPNASHAMLYLMSDLLSNGAYSFLWQKGEPEQIQPL
jgi:hypothetical protein